MRIETMHNGKTDQSRNGKLSKVKNHPWSEYKTVWVGEMNLWLIVKKSLTDKQIKAKIERFIKKYREQGPIVWNKGLTNAE